MSALANIGTGPPAAAALPQRQHGAQRDAGRLGEELGLAARVLDRLLPRDGERRLRIGDLEADAVKPVGARLGHRVDHRPEARDRAHLHRHHVAGLIADHLRAARLVGIRRVVEHRVQVELAGLDVAPLDLRGLERREDRGHRRAVHRQRLRRRRRLGLDAGGDGGEVGHRLDLRRAGHRDLPLGVLGGRGHGERQPEQGGGEGNGAQLRAP